MTATRYVYDENYSMIPCECTYDQSGSVWVSERDYEELEAQVKQLAAENAALNEKMNTLATWPGIEFYSSSWEFNNGDGNDALEFMCDVQTPATDAVLASLRAEGVEMFAEQQRSHIGMPNKNDAASSYSSREAIKFAAQLRSKSAPSPRVAATPETAAIARMFEQVKGVQS